MIWITILHYHGNYCTTIPGSHCECTHEFTSQIAMIRGSKHVLFIVFLCALLLHCGGCCLSNRILICLFQQGATKFHHVVKSPFYRRNGLNRTNAQQSHLQSAVCSKHTQQQKYLKGYDNYFNFTMVFIHNRGLHGYTVIVPAQVNNRLLMSMDTLSYIHCKEPSHWWEVGHEDPCTDQWEHGEVQHRDSSKVSAVW
jgi:hypothetical protein